MATALADVFFAGFKLRTLVDKTAVDAGDRITLFYYIYANRAWCHSLVEIVELELKVS